MANIGGKSYGQIFQEFEGHYAENSVQGTGDVKYHLGTAGVFKADSGETTKIYLAANPSHLEAVNPVLEGIVRAKQDINGVHEAYSVLPILVQHLVLQQYAPPRGGLNFPTVIIVVPHFVFVFFLFYLCLYVYIYLFIHSFKYD